MVSGPPTLEEQLGILKAIKETVDSNLSALHRAYADRQIGAVAWLSRNLLELAIWSEHCAASKESAKEFLLDSARDACDILNIPDGPWLHNSLRRTRQTLLDNAAADGFDIEQDYARVSAVAKRLGRGDVFKHLNKVFSKYAHPTALAIFSQDSAAAEEALRKKLYELGSTLAESALTILNGAGERIWTEIKGNKQEGRIEDLNKIHFV
jgi:hypothetical protein